MRQAAFLALLSGALLMAGHFSGAPYWRDLLLAVARFVEVGPLLRALFFTILAVASFGGAVVILGGLLILEGRLLTAKLLILLGTGFGLLSFVFGLALLLLRGDLPVAGNSGVVLVGVGLSVAARLRARGRRYRKRSRTESR